MILGWLAKKQVFEVQELAFKNGVATEVYVFFCVLAFLLKGEMKFLTP